MRTERERLNDIVLAADQIAKFIGGRTEAEFTADEVLRPAVLYQLGGDWRSCRQLTRGLRARHPEVDWAQIVRFRNVIVHDYFNVSSTIIWIAATHDVPELRKRVAALFAAEFP